jgi:hypothetical protein
VRSPSRRALGTPPGTPQRALWYQWIAYLCNPLASTYRDWFYPADLGATEHPPIVRAALQRRIEAAWDRLDAHLAKARPYLLGSKFSGADLYLTMLLRWSRSMPKPGTNGPRCWCWPISFAAAELEKMSGLEGLSGGETAVPQLVVGSHRCHPFRCRRGSAPVHHRCGSGGAVAGSQPQSIGPSLLFFFTFWPAMLCIAVGVFRVRLLRSRDSRGGSL